MGEGKTRLTWGEVVPSMSSNVISFIIQFCFASFKILFSTTDFFQSSSGSGFLLRGVVKWIRVKGVR